MFTQYNDETGKTTLTKLAKGGIITVAAVASLGIFRLTAVKRIPANTVGVKVSAIGGVQENTLQTGYHLKMPFIDKSTPYRHLFKQKQWRKSRPKLKMVNG